MNDNNKKNPLLPVDQALERILAAVEPLHGRQRLPLAAALGRVLAEEILSPVDVPPHRNSAMDGYALRAADLAAAGAGLTVIGSSFAGAPFAGEVAPGQCVRIMTGAVVPAGADTVVMQEQARREGDRVRFEGEVREGDNVRHPGEDLRRGEPVLAPGKRLMPAELGVLASVGVAEVAVRRRPRVAFFSTGDELRGAGEPLAEGQIYDSNRYLLHGLLQRLGAEPIDMGIIPDRREAVRGAFEEAAAGADLVLTSGGVSVGEADFVAETLAAIGRVDFWRIAIKPGKPLAFGSIGGALFFGLPGNPVSAIATFYQFVQPAIRRLAGEAEVRNPVVMARCADRFHKKPGRTHFQRAVLGWGEGGELVVRNVGAQGSHLLTSMSRANAFAILPAESGDVEPGTLVQVQPFFGVV